MSNLIIVESPTKARTLSRFLGKDYQVEATMGHIKDLPKSKISVDTEHDFKPDYQEVETRSKEIKKIKSQAKKADLIYLATDPDREGEAIAQHVLEIIDKKDYSRITFHEITKQAVEEAISHPAKVNKNLVDAQIARRVLDRLVGYKLSPVLWKKIRRGLSAGRVQTVVVRLIVEREREIEAFKPAEYWEILSNVKAQNPKSGHATFSVKLAKIDDKKAEIVNEKAAKKIVADLEKAKHTVSDIKRREIKKNPYPPYTTSTLTQAAANVFGWSSKKTMSAAQKLYEEGLITYHRTDSTNIADQAVKMAREFIKKEYGDKYLPEKLRIYKTKSKSAQEAHEAIRITDVKVQGELKINARFKSDAEKLYRQIWKRFVACQMSASISDSETIEVTALRQLPSQADRQGKRQESIYLLRVSGRVEKFDGWRKVFPVKEKSDVVLPVVEQGEDLSLIKVISDQKFTQPPARYNEASLIKTLEKLGIGRPSTYAPTISTIQSRQYVEKIDKRFYATPVGLTVSDFMIANFGTVFDYSFTASMEDDLDKVAKGEKEWEKMMKEFYTPFEKKVVKVEKEAKRVAVPTEKTGRKCPTCKKEDRKGKDRGELVVRTGRFGKFISCEKFPECKHTEKYIVKIGMKCPQCTEEGREGKEQGDIIVKRTRRGRNFFGCSKYPACEYASWKNPKDDDESSKTETDSTKKKDEGDKTGG